MSGVDFDFIENYRQVFKRKASNRQETLNLQRCCMLMTLEHAAVNLDNDVTCELFEGDLKSYCENFKELLYSPEQLCCFSKDTLLIAQKNSKSLKSSLNENPPSLSELLTELKGDCYGSNATPCALKTVPTPTSTEWYQQKNTPELPRKMIPPAEERHEDIRSLAQTSISQQDAASARAATPTSRIDTYFKPTTSYKTHSNSSKQINSGRPSVPSSNVTSITRHVPTLSAGKYAGRVGGWYKKKWGASKNTKEVDGLEEEEEEGTFRPATDTDNEPVVTEGIPRRAELPSFKTAGQQLVMNERKKNNEDSSGSTRYQPLAPVKSLGGKRGVHGKFVPPIKNSSQEEKEKYGGTGDCHNDDEVDPRLKHIPRNMVELIRSEIMDSGASLTWDDIAGLELAKSIIQEIVVWPMLRPDIFTGLRRPPKGILLFGPPGTGKTLIGKCIASQSKATFFSISASSLTSKWIGDGEKMVRALFAVARVQQPSVIFIDEIDSLLSQRKDTEHDSTRKMKTEFLIQLDGAATGDDDKILIIGATNRPQELDEAARRRLVKRLYIPLPDLEARIQLVSNLMRTEKSDLTTEDITEIAEHTDGYSGADVKNLCQEASLGPIRAIGSSMMFNISADQVRPVRLTDFLDALKRVRPSVSSADLDQYVTWDKTYGMGSAGLS